MTFTGIILTCHGGNSMEDARSWDVSFVFLHPSLLLDLSPVQMASAKGFTPSHRRWGFTVERILQLTTEWYQIGRVTCDRTSKYTSSVFCNSLYVPGLQPWSSPRNAGDNVMVWNAICYAPGNRTHVVIAPTLRSSLNILLLMSPLDLTCVPCASIYHNDSCIPTSPDAGTLNLTCC